METLRLYLPWPPSVNHYWRRVGNRTIISKEGREFRARVLKLLSLQKIDPMTGRLHVEVTVHPPDRRRRDLDNITKALLDALEHGRVYLNDNQIDRLDIDRGDVIPGGRVVVRVADVVDTLRENELMYALLVTLEWSHEGDEDEPSACPMCLQNYNKGGIHRDGCKLAQVLNRPTKPDGWEEYE